jgi:tRNA(Ile)-lysidine synthase
MTAPDQPLSPQDLYNALHAMNMDRSEGPVAVALSGGPDSMALLWLFSRLYAEGQGPAIEAVTIDHNLRNESASEAQAVGDSIGAWPGVTHSILTRPRPDSQTRIQETARADRYALLENFCLDRNIGYLFTAHHKDDQAETLLMRLAAGSGLDGLAGMRIVTGLPSGLKLCRPLLGVSKISLIATCAANSVSYVQDPSNRNTGFARIRLREAADILEREGLSSERLARTAIRLRRAAEAIDFYVEKLWAESVREISPERVVLKFSLLKSSPEDMQYRILKKAIIYLRDDADGKAEYGPRMDRLEEIAAGFFADPPVLKATLGGCLMAVRLKADELSVEREG